MYGRSLELTEELSKTVPGTGCFNKQLIACVGVSNEHQRQVSMQQPVMLQPTINFTEVYQCTEGRKWVMVTWSRAMP